MGRWLALAAARAGFQVLLEDVMPANLHHAQELLRQQLGPEALPAVRFVATIEEAVREADLVIDCVPDELESKLEILWLVDRMAPPRTVLATPTTHLSIVDLAGCTYRAGQCIAIALDARDLPQRELDRGGEIVLRISAETTDESAEKVSEFWRRVGFAPRFELEVLC